MDRTKMPFLEIENCVDMIGIAYGCCYDISKEEFVAMCAEKNLAKMSYNVEYSILNEILDFVTDRLEHIKKIKNENLDKEY